RLAPLRGAGPVDVADDVEVGEVRVDETPPARRRAHRAQTAAPHLFQRGRGSVDALGAERGAREPGVAKVLAHDVGDLDVVCGEEFHDAAAGLHRARRVQLDRGGPARGVERPPQWVEGGPRAAELGRQAAAVTHYPEIGRAHV